MSDAWDEYREKMIGQLREALDWLGSYDFVEQLREHWPGEDECKPLEPEELEEVIDKWVKS